MPHPEHAIEEGYGPSTDGLPFFTSVLKAMARRMTATCMTAQIDRPTVDTVGHAAQTPEVEQPWSALGLKEDEYASIREIIGRRPTSAELAMYSVMWSRALLLQVVQGALLPLG